MSADKNSTYVLNKTRPVRYTPIRGSIQTQFLYRIQCLLGRLSHQRKEEANTRAEVDDAPGDKGYVAGGNDLSPAWQTRLEHMIELNWVYMRIKRIRG